MATIVFSSLLVFAVMYLVYILFIEKEEGRLKAGKTGYSNLILLSIAAFAIRIAVTFLHPGYETDMACFSGWGTRVFEDGFSSFYESGFADYPPGYIYVLWIVGWLKSIFGYSSLIIKLPAICFDILAGIFVYKIAVKRFSEKAATAISGLFAISPAVIFNSSVWGQVDVVHTLAIAVAIYLVFRKKLISSYFVFAISIFIKPQSLIFTPVFLIAFYEECIAKFNKDKLLKHISCGIAAIASVFVLSLPFGLGNVLNQYVSTLQSYPYATLNAFNLYGAFNLNWSELTPFYSALGSVFIVLTVAYVVFSYIKGNKNMFFLGGVLMLMTFMLSTKMHERYAYPVMLLFLLAYVVDARKESMYMFLLTTFSQLVNTAFVLLIAQQDINYYAKSPFIVIFSIVNLFIFGYMFYACHKLIKPVEYKDEVTEKERGFKPPFRRFVTRKVNRLGRVDFVLIGILCFVYGVISFYDLGDTKAPQTYTDVTSEATEIELEESKYIDGMMVYMSCNHLHEGRKLQVFCETDYGKELIEFEEAEPFCWTYLEIDKETDKLTITSDEQRIMIMEIGIYGEDGLIELDSDSNLFDEQHLIPERDTYKNGTYFDEIYHARTGYEFVNGFNVYEWTHPPLGKVFIALGIKLFGMTPFGWRFVGNLFGILMIPLLYFFAKRLFRQTHIAFFTTLLFTFDFMHFVQTRIATIDVYGTFFIIMMYAFMYKYYQTSFYDTPLKKTFVPLLATGIAFGLGAASKWTAIYACCGIALLFFGIMFRRYYEYEKLGRSYAFTKKFIYTCLFCVLAFIIIPVVIYCLSYIPYLNTENTDGIRTIIENQSDMFVYHSKTVLNSEHPYASKWYTWLAMIRPVFYYSGETATGLKEGISAFGNPAVWWIGIVGILFNIYIAVVKNDRKARYLLVGYLSCLLPWIFVERTTYMYHYFPCVPFMVMMLGRMYEYFYYRNAKLEKRVFAAHVVVALILFAMFYPVLSGHGASEAYVDTFLKWLKDTWTLII